MLVSISTIESFPTKISKADLSFGNMSENRQTSKNGLGKTSA